MFVAFIVDAEGNVSSAEVVRSDATELNQATLDAINQMKFTPGTLGGEAVSVRMTVPITFKIPEMEEAPDDSLYTEVDQLPELIGGLRDLQQRVRYPTSALVHGVQGNVIVSFIVDEEGTVSEPRISGSVSYAIAQAAMEAVTQSSFTPGIKDGKPVKVKMTMPVTFRITPGSMPLAPVGYGLMICGSRTPLHTLPIGEPTNQVMAIPLKKSTSW